MRLSSLREKYIYYTSILFGIFITLSFIILQTFFSKPNQSQNQIKEFFENTPIIKNPDDENTLLKIPRQDDVFILITTLDNGKNISSYPITGENLSKLINQSY